MDTSAITSGAFAPATWSIGFLEAPLEMVAGAIEAWHQPISPTPPILTTVKGSLAERLRALEPFTIGSRREPLIQTKNPEWVAWFHGDLLGEPMFGSVDFISARIRAKGIVATRVPWGRVGPGDPAKFDALQLSVYGNERILGETYWRSISLTREDNRWCFETHGDPQPFEDTDAYRNRRKTDRFTLSALEGYCETLGLHPFEDEFYDGPSVFIEAPHVRIPDAPDVRFEDYPEFYRAWYS